LFHELFESRRGCRAGRTLNFGKQAEFHDCFILFYKDL
jgi:hypothetical protein